MTAVILCAALARDPKITPITRHEPRTFYATRVTRTQAGEAWDLWSVEDGRRVGFLSVVDDGHVVYALATVKRGTSHEEVADLNIHAVTLRCHLCSIEPFRIRV